MTLADAREALDRYGRGEVGLEETALLFLGAYREAARERDEREPGDTDPPAPGAWTMIAVARSTKAISPEQAAELVDAVIAWDRATA